MTEGKLILGIITLVLGVLGVLLVAVIPVLIGLLFWSIAAIVVGILLIVFRDSDQHIEIRKDQKGK